MVEVREIRLERLEGRCIGPCEITVLTYAEADSILRRWSQTAPRGGGYDKVAFTVVFEDGQEYDGRYDLTYQEVGISLGRHMQDFLLFASGRRTPLRMTVEQHAMILRRNPTLTEQAGTFLDTYQIGDC